jgi:RNA polymerase sigma-70 factor (ECF subfamily)
MTDAHAELRQLMQRLREGSPEAAQVLWERYGPHVLRVVRRRLDRKLRAKFDSADFAQAVWASFFVNPRHEYAFERPEDLLAFLAKLAQDKLVDAMRQRYGTTKYNINREQSLSGSAALAAAQVPARQPTPSQEAMARERWERMLEGLPAQHHRILSLRQAGYTQEEIAHEVGVSERTVRRLLQKLAPESTL